MKGFHSIIVRAPLLLLLQVVPLVLAEGSGVYDGGSALIETFENNPLYLRMQCTSRSRVPPSSDTARSFESNNSTETDDLDGFWEVDFPYCPEGYYCDLMITGNEENTEDDAENVSGLCRPCGGGSETCRIDPPLGDAYLEAVRSDFIGAFLNTGMLMATLAECNDQCGIQRNSCSSVDDCNPGTFCNFENSQDNSGFCESCPPHLVLCRENFVAEIFSEAGKDSCENSCSAQCSPQSKLTVAVSEDDTRGDITFLEEVQDVNAIHHSVQRSVTGRVVDCELGLEPCENAEGAVCLIERGVDTFVNKTIRCFLGGGVAAVIYNTEQNCENFKGTFWDSDTYIPAVSLSHIDGRNLVERANALREESKSMILTVEVGGIDSKPGLCELGCTESMNKCDTIDKSCNWDMGDIGECEQDKGTSCNDKGDLARPDQIVCEEEDEFCNYESGAYGKCNQCPANSGLCFFSDLNSQGAMECNDRCNDGNMAQLEAKPCKFCPKGSFTLADIADGFSSTSAGGNLAEPCRFCAKSGRSMCGSAVDKWDMKYPNRTLEMFGNQVECWKVAEFYSSLNIEADSAICASARSFNYVCGCSDSDGYAGAESEQKQKVLAWLPRVGAILSIIGSTSMIVVTARDEIKRAKVIGELIIFLSAFDIIGSLGYVFTSLPTPKEDYVFGARGNAASCTVQGFFIQVGTISLYINVSISIYYFLIIIKSWREHHLRKSWVYYMLFAGPIVVGAIFAFAGIPYYDNAILWCNNSQKYWSEIPIAIAIGIATILMIKLCIFVAKEESASSRFRRHSINERTSLSKSVFKQSLVYLGAFYLTWPAYLALQIMLANGKGYSQYGFILYAGTSATLQGFWNCTFHLGYEKVKQGVSRAFTIVSGQSIAVRGSSNSMTAEPSRSRFTRTQSRETSFGDLDLVVEESASQHLSTTRD